MAGLHTFETVTAVVDIVRMAIVASPNSTRRDGAVISQKSVVVILIRSTAAIMV